MGCDMHCHVEIKHKDHGWIHWNHPRIERSYQLFYTLAGVRPSDEFNWEPISSPKGLPDETTVGTRLDYEHWGEDAHSTSWLSKEELVKLENWFDTKKIYKTESDRIFGIEGVFGFLFGNSLTGLCKYGTGKSNGYPDWLEDVRIVFWFDD